MTDVDTIKRAAVHMLKMGYATPSEVAHLIGRSRQIVLHWAKDIDWKTAREDRLQRLMSKARTLRA